MSQAIYRKYRPSVFSEVIGQNHIKLTLQNEIELGNISHAYLFSGPRGIGKTSLARLFARAVNCENLSKDKIEPCNKCKICLDINSNRSMDVIEIDAASQTGVDNVRENIIENVRFTPHLAKYKVFIIDEVHMLSLSAFNALLKTLEEPPQYAIFILCTTELYKLPETIVSRCQRFDFKKIPAKDMIGKLKYMIQKEGVNVDDEVVRAVARKGDGFMRDAESLLGQVLALGKKDIKMDDVSLILPRSDYKQAAMLVGYIIGKNADKALDVVNNLVNEGVDIERFNQDIIEYLRKLILAKVSTQDEVDFSEDMGDEIEGMVFKHIEQVDLDKLIKMMNNFMQRQLELKHATIVQLPLELAVVELTADNNSDKKEIKKLKIKQSGNKETKIKEVQKFENSETGETEIENDKSNDTNKGSEEVGGLGNQGDKQDGSNETTKQSNGKIDQSDATNTNTKSGLTGKSQINTSIDEVKKRWNDVVEASKKYNHALQFILKIAYPIRVEDCFLVLGFEYSFHQERISDTKNKDIIDKILEEVFNDKIIVKAQVVSGDALVELKEEKQNMGIDEEKILDEVLEAFDGKLIENEN